MNARAIAPLLLLLSLGAPAAAQEVAPAAPAEGQLDPAELLRQMGANEEDVARFQLFTQLLGPDMGPLLLLMMMRGEGNVDDDALGFMLMMKAVAGNARTAPAALVHGDDLLVVEDGTVYRVDLATMTVKGSVAYRASQKAAGLPQELLPMLQQAGEKAQASACLSNMKQLCLGAMMYAQDWDLALPTEEWPTQLEPYLKNTQVYTCPGAPERAYGFALNEALVGAKLADIKRPAETVLFFEAGLPDDLPFGGADGLLLEPRHNGRLTLGFVDGHAKFVSPDEARKLLEQDPFE